MIISLCLLQSATKKVQVHLKETVPSKSRELCLLTQVSYQTVAAVSGTVLSQKVTIKAGKHYIL